MEWTRQVNAYCERTDFSYWSEPVNAVTNAAFLIAAIIMWRRSAGLPLGRLLATIVFAIGIGSYLFHTHATLWGGLADTLPIGLFILAYIFAMNLHVWRFPLWGAVLGTLAFIPYAMVFNPIFALLPFFTISSFYWPVPLLIFIYAFLLRHRTPETAKGLAIGATILVVSLTFRSVDQTFCESFPLGTHFMWHILNGIMLGWMIEVYCRHMRRTGRDGLAMAGAGR